MSSPSIEFTGVVRTCTPHPGYTPPTLEELKNRAPAPLVKMMRSLTQEQCDEAVRDFDRQVDQVVYQSPILAKLTSRERQSPNWEEHFDALFWYVFGYAQAKGWTSIEKRLSPSPDQILINERWSIEPHDVPGKCEPCGKPVRRTEGVVDVVNGIAVRMCSECWNKIPK